MPLFKSLLTWLGLQKATPIVGMRPHREIELAADIAQARERCLRALVEVAGANVQSDDGRTIEAGFGIVNSERLRITLEPIDPATTQVRIEAFYPARLSPPPRSMAVDALTNALQ